jgi:NitT/TauT family transport system substrate-binding protein
MTVDIRIGYMTTLYHTSFILIGSNLIEAQGIKASWKLFPNGPAMMEAFQRKELDMGYIGLPPVMIEIGRGLGIKCVAGGHVEGTVLIGGPDYQPSRTPWEALLQFKGKSIGTPKLGTIHDVILRKLIKDSGLADDITVKNYDWADFILDAMIDGEIDGGCGTPPLAVLAMHQMNAKILISPAAMWPFNPSYGIAATESMIRDSQSTLESFLKLHEEACNLLRKRPEEAAKLVHRAFNLIDEDFAMEVFRVSPKYCASLPIEYINSSMAFKKTLKDMRYLTRDLEKEDVFYTEIIEKVHPGEHHYDNPGKLR